MEKKTFFPRIVEGGKLNPRCPCQDRAARKKELAVERCVRGGAEWERNVNTQPTRGRKPVGEPPTEQGHGPPRSKGESELRLPRGKKTDFVCEPRCRGIDGLRGATLKKT